MTNQYSNESFDSMEGVSRVAVSCPISGERLDERAVRFVAWVTVTLLITYLIVGWGWIPFFLLVDFSMRGIISRKWAPLAVIARWVVQFYRSEKKLINAGPKIFAARMGISFSAILTILHLLGFSGSPGSVFVAGMFAVAAFLEAAFAFCLGCHIYHFIQQVKHRTIFGHGAGI